MNPMGDDDEPIDWVDLSVESKLDVFSRIIEWPFYNPTRLRQQMNDDDNFARWVSSFPMLRRTYQLILLSYASVPSPLAMTNNAMPTGLLEVLSLVPLQFRNRPHCLPLQENDCGYSDQKSLPESGNQNQNRKRRQQPPKPMPFRNVVGDPLKPSLPLRPSLLPHQGIPLPGLVDGANARQLSRLPLALLNVGACLGRGSVHAFTETKSWTTNGNKSLKNGCQKATRTLHTPKARAKRPSPRHLGRRSG